MYLKIWEQISFNAIFKILTLIVSFPLIKYTMEYLGLENFGIFIALTSLFSWMFLFDLGIAKGLRNYITTFLRKGEDSQIRQYISTTYISIFFITVFLFLLTIFLISCFNLNSIFNISTDENILKLSFIILIIGFFLKFYFSIVDQLFFAVHKSHFVSFSLFLTSLFNLIGILFLIFLNSNENLVYAVIVYSVSIIIPYFILTFIFFKKYPQFIPNLKLFSFSVFNSILKSGSKILLIQIGFLLMIGIDRILLLKYGSSVEVVKYEIIYKIMSVIVFPVSIIIAPLWSAFNDAFTRNDYDWIKKVFFKFYYLMIILFFIVIMLTFGFDWIINLWLNNFPYVEKHLIALMGILILLMIWSNFHSDFLLGINKYFVMKLFVSFGLILKILFLTYIYFNNAYLSLFDIIISSILAYSIFSLIGPIYIRKFYIKKV